MIRDAIFINLDPGMPKRLNLEKINKKKETQRCNMVKKGW